MRILFVFLIVLTTAFGASPAIGIITANGHFTVDSSRLYGNSTLFDGATVETDAASSQLLLNNGVKLQLATQSRARVFEKRLVIEKGTGQVLIGPAYPVEAHGLRIVADSPAQVRIGLKGARVEVAALAGSVRLSDSHGLLGAALAAGETTRFDPQAGGQSLTVAGCLVYKDGHYLVANEADGAVYEVAGRDVNAHVGNRVEAVGTIQATSSPVANVKVVLGVSSVTDRAQGGCLAVATKLGASTNAPTTPTQPSTQMPTPTVKAGGGGMSTGTKVLLVALLGGGGAAAGLAVALGKKSTSP